MTKDKILIDLLTIKARGGGAEEVKEYIVNLMNSLPSGDIVQKHRKAAGAIMAYGSYERGLFDEELLAEILERITNS